MLAQAGALTKALAGGPYLVARLFDYSETFVSGRAHEYGTTLLLLAGLFNAVAIKNYKSIASTARQVLVTSHGAGFLDSPGVAAGSILAVVAEAGSTYARNPADRAPADGARRLRYAGKASARN